MTAEERDQMNRLCVRIQQEKDPIKMSQLAEQLNHLIDGALKETCNCVDERRKGA